MWGKNKQQGSDNVDTSISSADQSTAVGGNVNQGSLSPQAGATEKDSGAPKTETKEQGVTRKDYDQLINKYFPMLNVEFVNKLQELLDKDFGAK